MAASWEVQEAAAWSEGAGQTLGTLGEAEGASWGIRGGLEGVTWESLWGLGPEELPPSDPFLGIIPS